MIERGGDEAGDAALHVDRAAPIEFFASNLAGERQMAPRRLIARRHDVGMAGEHEIGFFGADPREQIFDRRGAGLGEGRAMNGKPRFRQHPLQIRERPALLGRNRAAADEIAGDGDGIGGHVRVNSSPAGPGRMGSGQPCPGGSQVR